MILKSIVYHSIVPILAVYYALAHLLLDLQFSTKGDKPPLRRGCSSASRVPVSRSIYCRDSFSRCYCLLLSSYWHSPGYGVSIGYYRSWPSTRLCNSELPTQPYLNSGIQPYTMYHSQKFPSLEKWAKDTTKTQSRSLSPLQHRLYNYSSFHLYGMIP